MKTLNDGGSAFPPTLGQELAAQGNPRGPIKLHQGMSLRDWFAGQALCGMIAHQGIYWQTASTKTDNLQGLFGIQAAGPAYEFADAMIAAREAKQ